MKNGEKIQNRGKNYLRLLSINLEMRYVNIDKLFNALTGFDH